MFLAEATSWPRCSRRQRHNYVRQWTIHPRLWVPLESQHWGLNTLLLVCFANIPITPKIQHSSHRILQSPCLYLIYGSREGGVLCGKLHNCNCSYPCLNTFGIDLGQFYISTTATHGNLKSQYFEFLETIVWLVYPTAVELSHCRGDGGCFHPIFSSVFRSATISLAVRNSAAISAFAAEDKMYFMICVIVNTRTFHLGKSYS